MKKNIVILLSLFGLFFITGCENKTILIIETKSHYNIKSDAPVLVGDIQIGKVEKIEKKNNKFYTAISVESPYNDSLYSKSGFYIVKDKDYNGFVVRVVPSDKGTKLKNGDIVQGLGPIGYFARIMKDKISKGLQMLKNSEEWKVINSYTDSVKIWIDNMDTDGAVKKLQETLDSLNIDPDLLKEYVDSLANSISEE